MRSATADFGVGFPFLIIHAINMIRQPTDFGGSLMIKIAEDSSNAASSHKIPRELTARFVAEH